MKKLFFYCSSGILTLFLMTLISQSCVNPDYDLSKGIDMEMTLLPNTTIPLGDVAMISINNLLGDNGTGSSVFRTDENTGDLSLSFGGDVITQTFDMPVVEIGGDGGLGFDNALEVIFDPKYNGYSLKGLSYDDMKKIPGIPEVIHFSNENDHIIERMFAVDLNKELPEQIKDIDCIRLDSKIKYVFYVSEGTILHIKEGFMIEFPNFMRIAKSENSDVYKVEDNTVIFVKDSKISSETPLVLSIDFVEMDIPEGVIKSGEDGKRFIAFSEEAVKASGDLYLRPSDYSGVTMPDANLILNMDVTLDNLKMKSADVKLDMDIKIADKEISIGELPEMFSGEGTKVDLYNPIFRVKLDNDSPLEFSLNAGITSYVGNHTTDIHVGNYCINGDKTTENVVIPADGVVEYFFSRQGKHDSKDGNDIELDKLGDLISEVPDRVVIHDIHVDSGDSFITVNADDSYTVTLEYEFFSPLAFGKDLSISFAYDIDLGLNTEGNMGLGSLVLSMDMLNSIPLDVDVKGIALDADGNEIKDSNVDLDLHLAAGTVENPVPSPAEVALSVDKSGISISKLRLLLTADAPEDDKLVGISLNANQGIGINDLHISLPEGITLDLTNTDVEE